ncbi:MAG: alanine--tRNA ligase [Candidatus Thorarchaeota archaeon]|nr:alanine--tRNA ligase [Candidatus Thorarchaeota archaeon]MCK5238838.1 alanine--tRNA ligase [Candidatus Thorarchaeota archaeon]
MKAKELRKKYLAFFKEKKHAVITSSSLMPENDPTVLFTSAGMHPLVPYLLGEPHPEGNRLANCQKCVRTTDIDEVGDTTHLTFFEMLGNWSLNDYWKKEAITWSYEFLTSKKYLGFDVDKLSVTVFAGDEDAPRDEESAEAWKSLGIPEERIYYLPKDDNWWGPAGTTGPCGPDTEMFIEVDEIPRCGNNCRPGCSCGHYVEVWNDVFMYYDKKEDGTYVEMERRNIDTGMGVERTTAMLQGVPTVFDTDLFLPLINRIKEMANIEEPDEKQTRLLRVVADHVKSAVMIMADDRKVGPSNVEAGYIVRRLIRKAIHSADILSIEQGFMKELADITIEMYKDVYDEVERNKDFVYQNLADEEKKFRKTLSKALKKLHKILDETGTITGEDGFLLFTSFGLPIEMTREIAVENGIDVDMEDFTKQFEHHREISRTATQGKFKGGLADHSEEITQFHTATHLLQSALRKVLGNEVTQNGSNITKERLRFDFTFDRKLTPEEVKQVEDLVNEVIGKDLAVTQTFMPYDEAIGKGALAFFRENYGETVSVYSVGDFSIELCGGPHVETTGKLGKFRIAKQKKIGAGIMRIRAVLE